MKRWLSLAAIVVLGLALVIGPACGGEEEEEDGVTELKYGIGLPLSGLFGAIVGIPEKHAFELAAEKIGEFTVGGEQYRWKLIFEDNLASAAGGVASATKFIYEDDVDFMHQTLKDPGMAALPICQESGMLLGISTCNFDDFSPDTPYLFQTSATWSLHAPAFFDWLSKEHPEVKRVASCGPEGLLGEAIAVAVRASAEHYGLEIVAEEAYPLGMVEFMPIVTKIMARDPDLFLGEVAPYDLMRAMGYEGLAATPYWTESSAKQVGWDACQGYLIFMPHPMREVWPEVRAFRAEYEDRYDVELAPSAILAVNLIYVLTGALEQAGTVDDMDKIIETMETATFDTMFGPVRLGGEEINGIGHVAIYPSPIYKVIGEEEYELLAMYTAEETEALMLEVFK